MALKRPEGLSPCYNSLASPDIPESHIFKWTFRGATGSDYQTKYTIKLMTEEKTVLATRTVTSGEEQMDMADLPYSMQIGETYYWTVVAYGEYNVISEESVEAKFTYDSCPVVPLMSWDYVPKQGDVIVSTTYFQEIKDNIGIILGDYEGVPASLQSSLDRLFTGEVVPSRLDFTTLETVVTYLSTQLEASYGIDIDEPVRDSLGISDVERIKNHIIMLTTVPPKPVRALTIEVEDPPTYDVYGVNVTNDGKTDPTMDIVWNVEPIPTYSGYFTFDLLSISKDVRYYIARFEYGASTSPFASTVYYKAEDLTNGAFRSFETNWDGLYTEKTLGLAKQSLQVIAVDHRGNISEPTNVNKTYGSNFKAPLGVKYFEVEAQKAVMSDTKGPYPTRAWYKVYTGNLKRATHKVTGGEGRVYYRVRAVDYSGLTTPWVYDNGITFDPLTPPSAPRLTYTSTTTAITVDWAATSRAEFYEWKLWSGGTVTRITGTVFTDGGHASAHEYTFYVRAGNRVGWSSWVSINTKTKTARKTTERQALSGKSWNTKYGWDSSNGKKYVMQGEWVEIEGSPHQRAPAGTAWGKHKGMWMFDDGYWRSVLAGKKIIKVELWLQRQGFYHGYYNDQIPTFWLHNYDSYPTGQPMLRAKYQPGKEFDLGEKAWVTLPNYYGEDIRDGKARGIALYRDNSGQLPYLKYYPNAKLRITYE